ncbi:MAG: sigma-70 region 4 domain-containing protein, partial [Bacteroidaceae bacterium]|nr:sigma-70 region 4 domain-containing protein [Bacteroidaceae bacterium]
INRISDDELFRLIGELPEGYRVVFNLYCIDGCSHREIARLLGIKERTSASQLARAKALLASRIRQWIMDNGQ